LNNTYLFFFDITTAINLINEVEVRLLEAELFFKKLANKSLIEFVDFN
jgi:hypothetical protein